MNAIPTRRRFIAILPVAGAALLAACSPKPESVPVAPSPAAPVAETPPPAPTPAPVTASAPTPAAAPTSLPMLDEKDTQAMALGYAADATHTDREKYKNYVVGNQCSNCTLFQGQAGAASGGCPIFPGKQVDAKGWCASWVKRA